MRIEACKTLANIVGGTPEQAKKLLELQVVPKLLNLLRADSVKVKREVLWIIFNITYKLDVKVAADIVSHGAVETLCEMLKGDIRDIAVVLQSLNYLLKKLNRGENEVAERIEQCGGMKKIEALQYHENDVIYKLAYNIIENFFNNNSLESTEPNNISIFNF